MRSQRGHVYIELYILAMILGLAAAIVIPKYLQIHAESARHQCALALDEAAANNASECPLSGIGITPDPGAPDGSLCCQFPQLTEPSTLCSAPGAPVAASYPEPSRVRRIGWGIVSAIVGGIAVLFFGGVLIANVVSFVRSPKEWWASLNRRGF